MNLYESFRKNLKESEDNLQANLTELNNILGEWEFHGDVDSPYIGYLTVNGNTIGISAELWDPYLDDYISVDAGTLESPEIVDMIRNAVLVDDTRYSDARDIIQRIYGDSDWEAAQDKLWDEVHKQRVAAGCEDTDGNIVESEEASNYYVHGAIQEINGVNCYLAEQGGQGYYFKSEKAYMTEPDSICYISEYSFSDYEEEFGEIENIPDGYASAIPVDYVEKNKARLLQEGGFSTHNSILDEMRTTLEYEEYDYEKPDGTVIEAKDFDDKLIEQMAYDVFDMVDWQSTGTLADEIEWDETIDAYYNKNGLNESEEARQYDGKVQLQSVGKVNAVKGSNLKPGDIIAFNWGYTAKVLDVEPSASGKTVTVTAVSSDTGNKYTRKYGADRLVPLSKREATDYASTFSNRFDLVREAEKKKHLN